MKLMVVSRVTTGWVVVVGVVVGWTMTNRRSLISAFPTTPRMTLRTSAHRQKSRDCGGGAAAASAAAIGGRPRCITGTGRQKIMLAQAARTGDDYRGNEENDNDGTISNYYSAASKGPPPQGSSMDPRLSAKDGSYDEVNRVRQAYADWCRNYGKEFEERRLPIFAENFLRMEKYAQQTGERVKVNAYADLTTDEYRYMLTTSTSTSNSPPTTGQRRGTGEGRSSSEYFYGSTGGGGWQQQQPSQQEPPEWQQAAPTEWQRKVQETSPKGYETMLGLWVYFQTAFVGTIIGTLFVLPVTAIHYFVLDDFVYTTYAQWEWDLIASAVQGAMFATVYRYAMRRDWDNSNLSTRILAAFILVKSLVRVTVTADCAAYQPWLYCAEPYYLFNDQMAMQLFINVLESVALFVPVANVMKSLLEQGKIPPYDGYDA